MSSTPVLIWSASGRLDPLYGKTTSIPINLNPFTGATTVFPQGMVLGEVLASQGLYNWLNSVTSRADGTQNAKGILEYRAAVTGTAGSAGSISGVAPGIGGEWPGIATLQASMFKHGEFDLSKIIGLGTGADGLANLALLAGRLVSGSLGTDESDSLVNAGTVTGTFGLTIPAQTVNGYTYPAVTVANTALSGTATAAQCATAINNALLAAGVPAYVTCTGGALATNPVVIVFHGAYSARSITITTDATQLGGGTSVSTPTHGTAAYGIVHFG